MRLSLFASYITSKLHWFEFVCAFVFRLWDRNTKEAVRTLSFDASVSSMEYVPDGEILVITYGRTIAFYNAHR